MASYIGSNLWRFVYGIYFAVCNLLSHFLFLSKSFPFRLPYLFAEVWFLRAEAALRGWSSESGKECYEKGGKKKEGPRPSFIF